MKTPTAGLVVLLATTLLGTGLAAKDKDDAQRWVELDLFDGSRVVGISSIDSVPIQTPYAKVDVAFAHILTIRTAEDHETASIDLRNGDHLTGFIDHKLLTLETRSGKISLGFQDFRELRLLPPGGALPDSLSSALVLYYAFDHERGAKVTDWSRNAHGGAVHGATWTPNGKVGGAYGFDGHDDVITVDTFSTDLDDVTVSAWVKPISFDGDGACLNEIVDTWVGGGDTPFRLSIQNNHALGTLAWMYQNGSAEVSVLHQNLPANVWTHVAGVRRKTRESYELAIYINGLHSNRTTSPAIPTKHASQELAIGARTKNPGDDERFHGSIDEVLIFNRALSEAEVKQIYDVQK